MSVTVCYFYRKEYKPVNPDQTSYLDQLLISVNSLIKHVNPNRHYEIRVYTTEDTDKNVLTKIENLEYRNVSIKCFIIEDYDRNVLLTSGATPGKLYMLRSACKDTDRFLYLDLDTIVLHDIGECYDYDIEGFPVGGVTDFGRVFIDKAEKPGYIQGGLYLVNSKLLLQHLTDLSKLIQYGSDERAINSTVRKKLLPVEWNVTPHMLQVMGEQQIKTARIIHFAGPRDFINRGILKKFPEFCNIAFSSGYTRPRDTIYIGYMFNDDGITSSSKKVSCFDQLKISIRSAIKNADTRKHKYSITIYSIKSTIDSCGKELGELSSPGVSVTLCDIERLVTVGENFKFNRPGFTPGRMYGILAAIYSTNKTIFIDADTVFNSDPSELYNCDLGDTCLGGVTSFLWYNEPGRRPSRSYVNGGVLLIDCEKIKRFINKENISLLMSSYRDEEALLNGVIKQKTILPFEWNTNDGTLKFLGVQQLNTAKLVHICGQKNLDSGENINAFPEFKKWILDNGYSAFIRNKNRVLLERKLDALGDFVLMGDVIKELTRTYPELSIDVLCSNRARKILDSMGCCVEYVEPDVDKSKYIAHVSHVLYSDPANNRGVHILSSMFMNVVRAIGVLDESKISGVGIYPCTIKSEIEIPDIEYIIVPSIEQTKVESVDKEYAYWPELVKLLSGRFNVVELNTNNNQKTYEYSYDVIHTNELADTASLFKHARFSVLIENGMNHWACHNSGKTYCIFKGIGPNRYVRISRATPKELFYESMTPIECYNNESPEYVFSEIIKHEEKR